MRISIITICFNNLPELLDTCASVDSQDLLPYEHWIVDGSTEGHIRHHLENNPQPPYRKWLCERDKGISDAFNKGIQRAGGDVLNMLNSGDHYAGHGALQAVAAAFEKNTNISWVHGKCETIRGGRKVVLGKPFDPSKLYRGMRSVWHQTIFLRKEIHERYGLYDVHIDIAMDYDLLCRMAREPFLFLEKVLVVFAPHGISQQKYLEGLRQMEEVYGRYYPVGWKLKAWHWRLRVLHGLLKGPAGKLLYRVKTMLGLENL